jgi:3-oxoadipate enol-lactonase
MKQRKINSINVAEHGDSKNQSVIFIHAFPLCNRMWDTQVEALKDNYQVIAYDNRSFGYSEDDSGSLTIDTHVDDLFSIIEELKISKPVICGLSMGGYISLRALEKNSSLFKAVILCDTRSLADDNAGKIKRFEQIKQIKQGGRKEYLEELLKNLVSPKTLNGNAEKQRIVSFIKEIMSWQKDSAIAGALLTMAARTDTTESLANINMPALIIVGADDKFTPESPSRLMNEKLKGSVLKIIPDAGHFANMENSEAFNKEVIEFLKGME